MKLRTLALTVAVLVAACLAAYFLQRPASSTSQDPRINQPVLTAAVAEKAGQIRFVDQGKKVTIKKREDGSWIVPDYFDLPADFPKLSGVINDFSTDIKVMRLVTNRVDRLARLEFKETLVTLLDVEGKELWRVSLGKYADDGGRYLRFGEEPKAYQVTFNAGLDAEPKSWVDASLLKLKPDDVARIEIGFGGKPSVTFSRPKKDAAWTSPDALPGKQPKASPINSLVANLAALRFTDSSDLAAPEVGAARSHSRTVKLGTFDGKTYTLLVGRKPEIKIPKAAPHPGADCARGRQTAEAKPAEPEMETIPAGPVFALVTSSDTNAPINALMQKRAFQINEGIFNLLPAGSDELWEEKEAPATAPKSEIPPQPTGAEAEKQTPKT